MNDSLFPDLPESSESTRSSIRKWLPYLLVAVGVLVLLVVPVLVGGKGNSTETEVETLDPVEVAREEQQQLLEEVIDSIQPERLGIDVDESTIAQELNRWWIQYGPGLEGDSEFGAAHRESLQALLGGDASNLAMATDFGRRDVAHLATALAFRLAGLTITTGLSSDLEKVSASFYFVIRNLQVEPAETSSSAVFPYQALLWGRGRAEDRVWAFVEFLRQIRIDSIVVLPSGDDAGHPLVAVNVGDDLLLYDPALGLPIPSLSAPGDSPLPMQPATYAEALADDGVFRQLDGADAPYPWTSDSLRNVQLLVVGTDSTFSPRMEALQAVLPSQFSFVVFDGWSSSEFREESLQTRLQSLAKKLSDVETTVGAWNYPLSQAATYDIENGLDGTFLTEREGWLLAPTVEIESTDENGVVYTIQQTSRLPLQLVRTTHIEGDFDQAMRGYLPMRNAYRQNDVSENRIAAELAVFWSACCQFEFDRPDLAVSGFGDYLRDHSTGHFATSANYWLAVSLAESGDVPAALEALKSPALSAIPAGHIAYLTNRWSPSQETAEDAQPAESTEEGDPSAEDHESDSSEVDPAEAEPADGDM